VPELSLPARPLGDGQIVLREWEPADIPALVELVNDEAIDRFTMVPQPYGAEDGKRWLATHGHDRLTGAAVAFAIADASDGTLLGSIDLRVPDWRNLVGELGYLVGAPARGRGVAPAAAALLAGWGLREVGLARIEIYVEPGNEPSARVAEKAGFEREGLLRSKRATRHGRADMYLYSRVAG
jgi:RimJ/RimL family protein N-acetyltransferase